MVANMLKKRENGLSAPKYGVLGKTFYLLVRIKHRPQTFVHIFMIAV